MANTKPDASQINYTAAGGVSRTQASKNAESVSVLDFMTEEEVYAVQNNFYVPTAGATVTDVTAKIQAALDNGIYVSMPKGTYVTNATLNLWGSQSLYGEDNSQFAVTIKPTAAVTRCLDIGSRVNIEHITVDGASTTNATGVYISIGASTIGNVIKLNDILVTNFTGTGSGLNIREVVGCDLYNVRCVSNTTGAVILGATGSLPTYTSFFNCAFRAGGTGVSIQRGYGMKFYNCLFEDNANEGMSIVAIDRVEGVHVTDCWFERNYQSSAAAYNIIVDGTNAGAVVNNLKFDNNFFYGSNVAKSAKFSKALAVSFVSNQLPAVASTVLFDNSSTGWISEQLYNTVTGAIVDSTGFMVDDAIFESVWSTWTPTYTPQAGAYTDVTTNRAAYKKIGKTLSIELAFTGTLSLNATYITVSLPLGLIPASGTTTYVPATCYGEATNLGMVRLHTSGLIFYPSAGFTAGAARGAGTILTFQVN